MMDIQFFYVLPLITVVMSISRTGLVDTWENFSKVSTQESKVLWVKNMIFPALLDLVTLPSRILAATYVPTSRL